MPIARDTSTLNEANTNAVSFAHTNTGSNLLLVVGVMCSSGDNVTGVTYNSVALSQIVKVDSPTPGRFRYLYALLNPATGSNTVAVSVSGAATDMVTIASSYTGVDTGQTLNITDTTQSGTATSTTMNMTSAVDDSWGVMMIRSDNDAMVASTNASLVQVSSSGFDGERTAMFDTGAAIATAGAYTMVVTHTNNGNTAACSFTFAPATIVGPTNVKTFDGITQSTGIKTYWGPTTLANVKTLNGIS